MPGIVRKTDVTSCGDIQGIASVRTFYVDGLEVAVLGDMTLGHGIGPPTPLVQGSTSFFVDNKAVGRIGDAHTPHSYPPAPPHAVLAAVGSSSFFVDDSPPVIVFVDTLHTTQFPVSQTAAKF